LLLNLLKSTYCGGDTVLRLIIVAVVARKAEEQILVSEVGWARIARKHRLGE